MLRRHGCWVVCALSLLACGDSIEPCPDLAGTCSTSPTGEWTLTRICAAGGDGCDESLEVETAIGSLSLQDDGTASWSLELDYLASGARCSHSSGRSSSSSGTWRFEDGAVMLEMTAADGPVVFCAADALAVSREGDLSLVWEAASR